jgi:hypothetical protein
LDLSLEMPGFCERRFSQLSVACIDSLHEIAKVFQLISGPSRKFAFRRAKAIENCRVIFVSY